MANAAERDGKDTPPYRETLELLDQAGGTGGLRYDAERHLRAAQRVYEGTECGPGGDTKNGIAHALQAGSTFEAIHRDARGPQVDKPYTRQMLAWAVFYKQRLEQRLARCEVRNRFQADNVNRSGPATAKDTRPMDADEEAIDRKIRACIVTRDCGTLRGFDSYAGGSGFKALFRELSVLPIKFAKFQSTGGQAVLLFGPPGSGKSALAEAVAADLEGSFLSISAADLKGKYVGESEKSIKKLFSVARELTRSAKGELRPVVIFVDEIEGVVSSSTSGDDSSTGILSELNKQLQGVGSSNAGIITLAATNFPGRLPSSAISRFGDARLYVGLPTLSALEEHLYLLYSTMPDAFKAAGPFARHNLKQPRLDDTDVNAGSVYDIRDSAFALRGDPEACAAYWNFKVRKVFQAWSAPGTDGEALARAHTAFTTPLEKDEGLGLYEDWETKIVCKSSVIPVLALLAWGSAWSLRDVSTFWNVLKRSCAHVASDVADAGGNADTYGHYILQRKTLEKKREVAGKCIRSMETQVALVPVGIVVEVAGKLQRQNASFWSDTGIWLSDGLQANADSEVLLKTLEGGTVYYARRPLGSGAPFTRLGATNKGVALPELLAHAPATMDLLARAMSEVKASTIEGVEHLITFMVNSGRILTPGESQQSAIARLRYAARYADGTLSAPPTKQSQKTQSGVPAPTSTPAPPTPPSDSTLGSSPSLNTQTTTTGTPSNVAAVNVPATTPVIATSASVPSTLPAAVPNTPSVAQPPTNVHAVTTSIPTATAVAPSVIVQSGTQQRATEPKTPAPTESVTSTVAKQERSLSPPAKPTDPAPLPLGAATASNTFVPTVVNRPVTRHDDSSNQPSRVNDVLSAAPSTKTNSGWGFPYKYVTIVLMPPQDTNFGGILEAKAIRLGMQSLPIYDYEKAYGDGTDKLLLIIAGPSTTNTALTEFVANTGIPYIAEPPPRVLWTNYATKDKLPENNHDRLYVTTTWAGKQLNLKWADGSAHSGKDLDEWLFAGPLAPLSSYVNYGYGFLAMDSAHFVANGFHEDVDTSMGDFSKSIFSCFKALNIQSSMDTLATFLKKRKLPAKVLIVQSATLSDVDAECAKTRRELETLNSKGVHITVVFLVVLPMLRTGDVLTSYEAKLDASAKLYTTAVEYVRTVAEKEFVLPGGRKGTLSFESVTTPNPMGTLRTVFMPRRNPTDTHTE